MRKWSCVRFLHARNKRRAMEGLSTKKCNLRSLNTRASPEDIQQFICNLRHVCPNMQRITVSMLKYLPEDFVAAVCQAYLTLLVLKICAWTTQPPQRQRLRESVVQVVVNWFDVSMWE